MSGLLSNVRPLVKAKQILQKVRKQDLHSSSTYYLVVAAMNIDELVEDEEWQNKVIMDWCRARMHTQA